MLVSWIAHESQKERLFSKGVQCFSVFYIKAIKKKHEEKSMTILKLWKIFWNEAFLVALYSFKDDQI